MNNPTIQIVIELSILVNIWRILCNVPISQTAWLSLYHNSGSAADHLKKSFESYDSNDFFYFNAFSKLTKLSFIIDR